MSAAGLTHGAEERRQCILIADDEPVNLEILFNTLAHDGNVDVVIANDGRMVLELVAEEKPDLILLDAVMPGLSGFEVCRALKASETTADLPVIFVTSLTETARQVEAFEAGAVDFISKPFDRVELLARVKTQLILQRTTKALAERNARLEEHIRQRDAAEASLAAVAQELERRTEELRQSNERLKAELDERARAEAAKTALQEEIIRAQRDRLLELSTPLIPITEDILAMPLVGTLDVERAQQIVEAALFGASRSQARFVIVDITGVRAADANVASMLVRLANSLRLLGRRALITGISPEMAQAFVALDTPLDGIVTSATLQSGIRRALEVSNEGGSGERRSGSRSPLR